MKPCALSSLALVVLALFAATASAGSLRFDEARALLRQAPKLAAARAAESAAALQSEAAQDLGGPLVVLRGSAMRYRLHEELDMTPVQEEVAGVPLLGPLLRPRIPDTLDVDYQGSRHGAQLAAVWPIYAGGRFQAAKSVLAARADEAAAETTMTAQALETTLSERYFGSQLAALAAALHERAVATIGEYDHTAQRMLDEGLIARAERLQAQAKLAEAETAREKAKSEARLSRTALRRLLAAEGEVEPATPLFINTRAIEPLDYFQDLALQSHPGPRKVAAKRAQAEALHKASTGRYLPTVNLFGMTDVTHGKPTWVAGVSASWVLWSWMDRGAMSRASAEQIVQAEKSDEDARQNILLLVEKNWRAQEDARLAYLNMGRNVELYEEVLRLRRAGLREGLSTVAEAMEAETQLLKARTERARTANDYVQALSQLFASCGAPQFFDDYMARADVRLNASDGRLADEPPVSSPSRKSPRSKVSAGSK